MNLSISNIAWAKENDEQIYSLMKKYDFSGLEIAPTKIFPENPYDKIQQAELWAKNLSFTVPSMQSIWYGRSEKIFGTQEERQILTDYTKKAIDFAVAIGCKNLVFGCPKNRNINSEEDIDIAEVFFREIGDYAYSKNTFIGMEANPAIYNTNFINDTLSAIELIKKVNSKGFRLNLDIGTMIYNNENPDELKNNVHLINHVHISEPYLVKIENRELHKQIAEILKKENYQNFISVEMKQQDNIEDIEEVMKYTRTLL